MADVTLYEIPPSPSNTKVRIALNYKGIGFDRRPVDPDDRSEVAELSGQPLTPVIVHGDVVVWDSAAILRYLEGNFPASRPLFSTDVATMRAIEEWESFGRGALAEPFTTIFDSFRRTGDVGPELVTAAQALLTDRTETLESALQDSDWLVGPQMTAADVTAAPLVFLAMVPPETTEVGTLAEVVTESLQLPPGRERTEAWAERVMALDR